MKQVRIRVGDAVCKVDIFILLGKLISKGETFSKDWVIIVGTAVSVLLQLKFYVCASLVPGLAGGPETVRLHALIVEQTILLEVDNVKPYCLLMAKVTHFKVKPGVVPLCITIHPHQQIIFRFAD
jgi:hypothetical protein